MIKIDKDKLLKLANLPRTSTTEFSDLLVLAHKKCLLAGVITRSNHTAILSSFTNMPIDRAFAHCMKKTDKIQATRAVDFIPLVRGLELSSCEFADKHTMKFSTEFMQAEVSYSVTGDTVKTLTPKRIKALIQYFTVDAVFSLSAKQLQEILVAVLKNKRQNNNARVSISFIAKKKEVWIHAESDDNTIELLMGKKKNYKKLLGKTWLFNPFYLKNLLSAYVKLITTEKDAIQVDFCNNPALVILSHPSYDVRGVLLGCE